MPTAADPPKTRVRPGASIIAVAAFQIVVGILALIPFERGLRVSYFSDQYSVPASDKVVLAILFATAVFGILTGIGLLKLCNWARWLTLFLATVPVCAAAIGAITYKRQPGFDFITPLILDALLVVLVPVSIWWWILFTRANVRGQFP